MVKRTANIIDRQSKFLRYFIVQENIKENKMYYKELFDDKAQRKDRLKIFLLIMAVISLILGLLAIVLFCISLHNSEVSFAIDGNLDLEITSQVATVVSGLIGTLLSFSSILLVILTIRVQQKEINDSHRMQKNNAILELFYKSLDCIDTSIINDDRIKNLIISEYGKFALVYLEINLSNLTNTIDLAIQTLTLADKMKYLREPLNLKKIEASKAIYDKANKDLLKTELLYKTHSLNDTICNSLLLMDSLSEEIQESCFILLKSRLGIMGNRLLLIFIFLNQISWNTFKFYTLNDVMELFHNGIDSLDNEYSMQVTELVKEYLSKNT